MAAHKNQHSDRSLHKATLTYAVSAVFLIEPIKALLRGGFPPWATVAVGASYITVGTFLAALAVFAMRIANALAYESATVPTRRHTAQEVRRYWRPLGLALIGTLTLSLTSSPLTERASATPLIALLLFTAATGEWLGITATSFAWSSDTDSSRKLSNQLQKELRAVTRTSVVVLLIAFLAIDLIATIGQ